MFIDYVVYIKKVILNYKYLITYLRNISKYFKSTFNFSLDISVDCNNSGNLTEKKKEEKIRIIFLNMQVFIILHLQ